MNISKMIEELAVKIMTGKTPLRPEERDKLFEAWTKQSSTIEAEKALSKIGTLSEKKAKKLLSGWLGKISEDKRKKILSKMD